MSSAMDANHSATRAEDLFRRYLDAARDGTPPPLEELFKTGDAKLRRDVEQMIADYRSLQQTLGSAGTVGEGETLGDYRLLREIGRGGMGVVFEAEQVSLGRRVALKLLHGLASLSPGTIERFHREARAGGRAIHPGIILVFAVGEHAGRHYIVQELVAGGHTLADELADVRAGGELPPDYYQRVTRLFADVADALQAAHDAGVIHRDLKPSNVLITESGAPRVGDFGLAKISGELSLSNSGQLVGTPFYMSPEQVASKRTGLDHRTDIFSLGATMYEALTLRYPFEGDTREQVLGKILFEDPLDPRRARSRVPPELAVICLKALEKKPERRYGSAREMAADLRRWLANEPILARPPGSWTRAVKWMRRNPAISSACGVGLAALVIVLGLLLGNLQTNRELARTYEDVLSLSASKKVEELFARADRILPPHPDLIDDYRAWIDEAKALSSDIDRYRQKREELYALALPAAAEREPRAAWPLPEELSPLEALRGERDAKRAALLERRDGIPAPLPEVDMASFRHSAVSLHDLAASLVKTERRIFGREALGLLFAQEAIARAETSPEKENLSNAYGTLSSAFFALGRDEEALEAARTALELAWPQDRARFTEFLKQQEAAVALETSAEGLARAEAEVNWLEMAVRHRSARFPDTEEGRQASWWHAALTDLIERLEDLSAWKAGLLAEGDDAISPRRGWSIPRRLAHAQMLQAQMAEGGAWHARWRDATLAVRSHPRYGGLELKPEMGLVPIGQDPSSGLWEFWHVASGEEPVRGADGALVLTPKMGIVLVLIPGGKFLMGAQGTEKGWWDYDELATPDESPSHDVELSPYFLSKFEMTQGQWERFAGANPSFYGPHVAWDPGWLSGGRAPSLLHPVEMVPWTECVRLLARMGLALPTEAQWEYGCRAGTRTPWSSGENMQSLQGATNLADSYARQYGGDEYPLVESWLDDGATPAAPVGSYAANAFGLHDMHGNLWEWCEDEYDPMFYARSEAKDPRVQTYGRANRVIRGASYSEQASYARSSKRGYRPSTYIGADQGVRPAKALTR